MMKIYLVVMALTLTAATASAGLSDREIREGFASCQKFLALSRAKQLKVAKASGHSLAADLWACRYQKKMGLAKTLHYNHEYNRWERSGGSSSGSSDTPSWATPSSSDDHVSPSLQPGTCYDITGCNGASVHVENGPGTCPAGYSAFQYDMGGNGCGSL